MNYRRLGTSDIEVGEVSLGRRTTGGLNWVNGQPNGFIVAHRLSTIRRANRVVVMERGRMIVRIGALQV
jgi:aryl-alcohol dehydrogenase-like predicted oxidoreductase